MSTDTPLTEAEILAWKENDKFLEVDDLGHYMNGVGFLSGFARKLERTLATKELAETKLREALRYHQDQTRPIQNTIDILSTPITTEALDSYVAGKVKETQAGSVYVTLHHVHPHVWFRSPLGPAHDTIIGTFISETEAVAFVESCKLNEAAPLPIETSVELRPGLYRVNSSEPPDRFSDGDATPPVHPYDATQLIADMVQEFGNRGETTSVAEWHGRCKAVISRMKEWLASPPLPAQPTEQPK